MAHPFETASHRLNKDLIEIKNSDLVRIDLRYCGTNNFMHVDLYGGFHQAFLHQVGYDMFQQAQQELQRTHPHLRFVIFDALRPRSVQKLMREFVASTPYKDYVADPVRGSLHNFGMAIDLSLEEKAGGALDMGTEFDDFHDLAQPKLEEVFLTAGTLKPAQLKNRMILRSVMEHAGFQQLPHEWWHYNALPIEQVRREFQIIE